MPDRERVGFVGLGIMGKAQAANLLKAGFPLTVYNRTRSKADELGGEGATVADTPADVARNSDITITMVSDSPDVEQVILGKGGVIEGAASGSVVIDMSTISPQVTQNIAGALGEKGVSMLDAPVSGGSWGADTGDLVHHGGRGQAGLRPLHARLRSHGQDHHLHRRQRYGPGDQAGQPDHGRGGRWRRSARAWSSGPRQESTLTPSSRRWREGRRDRGSSRTSGPGSLNGTSTPGSWSS